MDCRSVPGAMPFGHVGTVERKRTGIIYLSVSLPPAITVILKRGTSALINYVECTPPLKVKMTSVKTPGASRGRGMSQSQSKCVFIDHQNHQSRRNRHRHPQNEHPPHQSIDNHQTRPHGPVLHHRDSTTTSGVTFLRPSSLVDTTD